MSLTELARLDAERLQPRIVTLHFALARLRSCVSFMNSGAHPDDETSALLAVLGFRDGLDLSYACANRGEGGQNDIGTEALAALGTLRTAEMEKAAEVLDCRLYWLSHSPEDSITDFGFSKSGDETLQYWQHEHALKRFVSIVRREKPDILCPTFLDVPGQHGHHRAMTALAHEAMDCAADAAFKIDALPPWTISKLYLPAWGGGGSSYDDEEAPPKATLSVRADGHDELTGWTWEHIAQQSRRFHRTQNMGRWIASGSERNWPLHLAISHVDGPDETPLSGLPSTLGALAEQINDSGAVRGTLISAQQAIDDTLAAFPDFPQVALQASRALVHIHQAMDTCPDSAKRHVMHRLQRKQAQLSRVIRLALGVRVRGCITGSAQSDSASTMSSAAGFWQAGERHGFELEVDKRQADALDENCLVEASLQADAPWQLQDNALSLADTAQPSEAYPNRWLPDEPTLPRVQLRIVFEGVTSTTWHALENPPVVLPSVRATLYPNRVLINTARSTQAIDIALVNTAPDDAQATLAVDEQWKSCADEDRLQLTHLLISSMACMNGP